MHLKNRATFFLRALTLAGFAVACVALCTMVCLFPGVAFAESEHSDGIRAHDIGMEFADRLATNDVGSIIMIAGEEHAVSADFEIVYDEGSTAVFTAETKTLTLTDAAIPAVGNPAASIIANTGINIVLVGQNALDGACAVNGDLSISGNGSLSANFIKNCGIIVNGNLSVASAALDIQCAFAEGESELPLIGAIIADGSLTVEGATITATAYDEALFSGGAMTFSGGSKVNASTTRTEAESGESNDVPDAICSFGPMKVIGSSEVTAGSSFYAVYADGGLMVAEGSTVTATSDKYTAIAAWGEDGMTVSDSTISAEADWNGLQAETGMSISNSKLSIVGGVSALRATSFLNLDSCTDMVITGGADAIFVENGAAAIANCKGMAITGGMKGVYADSGLTTITDCTGSIESTISPEEGADDYPCALDVEGVSISGPETNLVVTGALGLFAPGGASFDGGTLAFVGQNDVAINAIGIVVKSGQIVAEGLYGGVLAVGDVHLDGGHLRAKATHAIDGVGLEVQGRFLHTGGTLDAQGNLAAVLFYSHAQAGDKPGWDPLAENISLGANYVEKSGAKLAGTGWVEEDGQWAWRGSFVPTDDTLLSTDLSNALKSVSIVLKSSDPGTTTNPDTTTGKTNSSAKSPLARTGDGTPAIPWTALAVLGAGGFVTAGSMLLRRRG